MQGLGLAGGLGIASIISKTVDVLGDAVAAAKEDQVSVQQLGTALRDSIKDWNGNTEAIERTIKARIALGFSDDDQRAGLATLVRATNDETKALALEAGAMDIARARKVDLATASDAVAKAYAGNTKGLKSLIPGLKLGATNAETLANAFAAVSGSAKDYAETDAGKAEVATAKVNEALEKLGYTILPAVTAATVGAADAVSALAGAFDFLQNGVAKTTDGQVDQLQSSIDLQKALAFLFPIYGTLADAEQEQVDKYLAMKQASSDSTNRIVGDFDRMGSGVKAGTDKAGDAVEDFADTYRDEAGAIIRSSHRVRDALVKDAAIIRGEVFDETEIRASLHDQRLALFELKNKLRDAEAIKDAGKRKEAIRQASDDIIQALDDEGESLEDLAAQGKLTQQDVDRFTKDAKASYGSLSKDARAKLDALISKYQALVDMPNVNKKFTVQTLVSGKLTAADLHKVLTGIGSGTHPGGTGPQEFAEGGYRPPGVASWVGERGRELSIPTEGSFILPHDLSEKVAAMASVGGGGGDTIQVNMLDRMPVTSVQDIGDRLRMLEQRGYLRRRIR